LGFFRRLFSNSTDAGPLALIDLEDERLRYKGIINDTRVWYTEDGDGIGLYYFSVPPDLPKGQPSVARFCESYTESAEGNLVQVGVETHDDLAMVKVIGKAPQIPSGNTYVGSFILPFDKCSYVVKIQCEERGITGVRESMLLVKEMTVGERGQDEDGNSVIDLSTDDEIYDTDFPGHPLSRCRRGLSRIAASLRISEEVRALPKFDLPNE